MLGNLSAPDTFNSDNSSSVDYNILLLIAGLTFATYLITKYAQARNRIQYDNHFAREIAAFIKVVANMWHTNNGNKDITSYEGQVLAVGQHTLGVVDGMATSASLKGIAPHVFATDAYDFIPGVYSFLKMFQAIKIKTYATQEKNGRSANDKALDEASEILKAKGCIALFPQGNMSKIGQEPHRVYDGAAKLAVFNNVPIRVIRLDGFWSVDNPLIPVLIRNWNIYRALLSAFHPNNVRVTDCGVIDSHLKQENALLSPEDKIYEINAQLYAFFRHPGSLTLKQIDAIKDLIVNKTHHLLWANKLERDKLVKELANLDKSTTSPHQLWGSKSARAELIKKIADLDKERAKIDEETHSIAYKSSLSKL